jgi:hypothetical protein
MDLKREQLKNKIALILKDFLEDSYRKPTNIHYYLPDKYSKKIMKEIEEWKTL